MLGLSCRWELESQFVIVNGCDQPVEPSGAIALQCEEWFIGASLLDSRLDIWNYQAYGIHTEVLY